MPKALPNSSRQLHFKLLVAVPVGRGRVYLGWAEDTDATLNSFTLFFADGDTRRLALNTTDTILICTPRPVDRETAAERRGGGFAIWIPGNELRSQQPMATLNDQAADLTAVPLLEPARAIAHADLLEAYGSALAALARSQSDAALTKLLEKPLAELATRRGNDFAFIEQAWRIAGHLLLIGRITCEPHRLEGMRYQAGRASSVDIRDLIQCFPLSTHQDAKGKSMPGHITGFCGVIPLDSLPRGDTGRLLINVTELGELNLPLRPLDAAVEALPDILISRPQAAPPVLDTLRTKLRGSTARRQLAVVAGQCFDQFWPRTTHNHQYGDVCAAGIGGCYALGDAGIAIFGSLARPEGAPLKVYLHAEENLPIDITKRMAFLPIDGDLLPLQEKFPTAARNISFFVHAPVATKGGERRLLRFVMPGVPDLWVRAETRALQEKGNALARAMLGHLPRSPWLWRNFAQVCDRGLGKMLELTVALRPAERSQPQVHEFGAPPRKPWLSIIVPLYGRYDFMRHQLAQFCDDTDFASGIDLIYVVDDPEIETATLNLAARFQPLFNVSLRVVTYGENRGFAGANNAGVALSRAPLLLLMNSDVLPQQPGWLSALRRAYDKLPRCGMVAPLLQYPEGSVQHAGMAATRQATNPDLIFSHHPGKGCEWEGGNEPTEQAMLTGACLMLSKKDYEAVGGLDANYIVGDFEDSDFSLKLRARDKRLYLVPTARLWHLERQSQYLGDNAHTVRDMLTLYNAWRYRNKIAAGLLPDPGKLRVMT